MCVCMYVRMHVCTYVRVCYGVVLSIGGCNLRYNDIIKLIFNLEINIP